jgi:cell wall-associated NlpC family hydrolase
MTFAEFFFKKVWNRSGEVFHGPLRFPGERGSACPAAPANFWIPVMRKLLFWLAVLCLWAAVAQAEPCPVADVQTYVLQTAAFVQHADAEKAAARLQDKGEAAYVATNSCGLFVVRSGCHASRAEARQAAARLQDEGLVDSFLIVKTRAPEVPGDRSAPEVPAAADPPAEEGLVAAPTTGETAAKSETSEPGENGAEEAVTSQATVGSHVAGVLEMMARHPVGPKSLGFRVAQIALDFLGVKYHWGGMSRETGMDCSGFVKTVYALCGIELPRTSAEQFRQGQAVDLEEMAAGDLVFFGRNHRVNHVGIYLGEGKFIHAPRARETIRISSLEERSALRRFLGARRLLFDQ